MCVSTLRVWESEALEGAGWKVESLQRLYLRTLKALQDLARRRPPVGVRHVEQMNVGPIRISVDNLFVPTGHAEPLNKAEIEGR